MQAKIRWLNAAWIAGLALMGCSGEKAGASKSGEPQASSHTNAEKVVNVFNWSDFIDPTVTASFEKEYGVHVNYSVYDSNEQLETVLLTGHSNYDVVVPGGAFFERGIKINAYLTLDKARIANVSAIDPAMNLALAIYDPGNAHGVGYAWPITTGLGYDETNVKDRVPDAPTKSWRLLFDPTVAARLKGCGIAVLDAPQDVVSAALAYLGRDPNSETEADLKAAETVLTAIRPSVRYIDATRYISDLANGEICLAIGWSGDFVQARVRAEEAGKSTRIHFFIPTEGALSIIDVMAIPSDAPHVDNAYLFINYLLRPDIAARNTNATRYANGVPASLPLIAEAVRNDPAVYPTAADRAHLVPHRSHSPEYTRALTRAWTRFKTGQ